VTVQVVHEFDNIETIKRAIEIGSGVALLPKPTVWQEISSGTLSAVNLSDVALVRPLGIVHKRNKQLTTAVLKFIELLHQDETHVPPEFAAASDHRQAISRRSRGNGKRANGHATNGNSNPSVYDSAGSKRKEDGK
jgi:hypothetical protein